MNVGRICWIDSCKGFAIFLVILGHTLRTDLSLVYIYCFHMPLFFFLSGLVCNEQKYMWQSFLKNRFNSLMIPYFVFYLLTWLYWLFVERRFRPLGMEWWESLIGMFYGTQWHGYMDHNGILWFLPCLFVTEVIFFAVKRVERTLFQWILVAIISSLGFLLKHNLPWGLNIALVALQFFYIGNLMRSFLLAPIENREKKNLYAIFSILLVTSYLFLASILKNYVNMATSDYGQLLFFEVLAYIGIIGFVIAFKAFNIRFQVSGWLGRNTLVVFALHQPILRVVRFFGDKLVNVFPYETNLLYALMADFIVVSFLIPLIWIYNRYGLPVIKKIFI